MKQLRTLLLTVLLVPSIAAAGQWLAAEVPEGKSPFAPVPLYWFRVVRSPCIYRKVVEVPAGVDRATALLRGSAFVYVRVDGRQVFAWGPAKDSAERPQLAGDPSQVHELNLSEQLTPGSHVLTVSAPAGRADQGGFVLDGGLYAGAKRVAALASDGSWTATVFRPTEILEDHPIMTAGYDGKAQEGICTAAGKAKAVGEPWTADEDALAAAHFRGLLRRFRRGLDDTAWRLELLARKGIYLAEDAPRGWGGPHRPAVAAAARAAADLLPRAAELTRRADELSPKVADSVKALAALAGDLGALESGMRSLCREADGLFQAAARADDELALQLAGSDVRASAVSPATGETLRKALVAAFGHALGRLNESRYDRLGWLPHPQLSDSDIGRWGIRVNPVTGPAALRVPPRWRFSTDPQDVGLKELRHTIGYNIESQWAAIDGQQGWQANRNSAGYAGIGWYRNRVVIPAEWAGSDVMLSLRIAGKGRVWLNDQEITDRRKGQDAYLIPSALCTFGSENLLAARIDANGPARGLVGPAELRCPSLEGPAGKDTPQVDVLATPLSPCVVLAGRADELRIHHAGQAGLVLPGGKAAAGYDAARDGKLAANWALLWLAPASQTGVERPILLVLEKNPAAIACEGGLTKVKTAGGRVIAVRPWAKAIPKQGDAEVAAKAAFWSRAALAVPINYMTVTTVLKKGEPWEGISIGRVPAGPVLSHTSIYDYLITKDEWGTEPLKLAPLPALCSLAVDSKFRGLKLDAPDKIEIVQDGGLAAPYRAIRGADRVSYSYPVEPWPRFVGFTSWMFAGSDVGVPGNDREVETIAATGANSYRPQNNFAEERAAQYAPGENRTRIQVMADLCRRSGLNFMNNIDQTLGPYHKLVREDYDKWVQTVLYPHYEKLVPQLKDRAFWEVAYDLVNEPFDHKAAKYNPVMRELTARVRKTDRTHLLYIEPCQAWGAIQQLDLIEPTGDPLTMYSFHDYNFRMMKAEDRWPTLDRDISTICRMWWPAFAFAIGHGVGMHCGEYGGFGDPTDDLVCQKTLMHDFLRVFDQFGMHHHYYTGRGIYQRQLDGSLRPSNVVRVFRQYARRPDLNAYYPLWPGHPKPTGNP